MTQQILKTVVEGLRFPEGNRWHDGALWFSDMHTGEVFRWDPGTEDTTLLAQVDGQSSGLAWTSTGKFVVSSMLDRKLYSILPGGELETYADLSELSQAPINDIVLDEQTDRLYVGGFGYDLYKNEPPSPGPVFCVDPDGSSRLVADGFTFPNAAVILPGTRTIVVPETWGERLTALDIAEDGSLVDRRLWAQLEPGTTPDGTCVDAEGGIWLSSLEGFEFQRVLEGGEVTNRIPTPGRHAVDCVLGGPEGRTLYLSTADSYTPTVTVDTRLGLIQAMQVDVPAAL